MRLKYLFLILVTLVLVLIVALIVVTFSGHGYLFYLAEVFSVVCIAFLFYFYKKVLRPFDALAGGMDLLKEQDLTTRLAVVGQKDADRIVVVFNRLLDRLKEERLRLMEQNHFLDLLIEASPMGVVILNLNEEVAGVNAAAMRQLECSSLADIEGKTFRDIDSPLSECIQRLGDGESDTVRLGNSKIYRCSRLSFLDRGFHHPFILVESLTEEVMEAEKRAYEKVIRMIAHEVNNNVAGVNSTLGIVEQEVEGDLKEVVRVCAERSVAMSRFITRFADVVKIPEPELCAERVNTLVSGSRCFLESLCGGSGIRLHVHLCEENPEVKVDAALFEQVLVNIVKNSAESIGGDGDITISTYPDAVIEVADNGAGIAKEAEDKLFSPFFSTKPQGQGIGLLLIREVLTRHHCSFSLRTYKDGITRFRIAFG